MSIWVTLVTQGHAGISEVTGDSIDMLVRNYVHLVPGSTYNPVRTVAEVIRNREDHQRTMEAR